MFLMRMRGRMPFEGLRILFGLSVEAIHNYYVETVRAFHEDVVPRLLYPLSAAEIEPMIPEAFRNDLPGVDHLGSDGLPCQEQRERFAFSTSLLCVSSPTGAGCSVR